MKKLFSLVAITLFCQTFMSCSPGSNDDNQNDTTASDTSAIIAWYESSEAAKGRGGIRAAGGNKIMTLAPGPTEPFEVQSADDLVQNYHNSPLENLAYTSYLIKVSELQKILSITPDKPDYLHVLLARKAGGEDGEITLVIAGVNSAKEKHVYFKDGVKDMVLENVDPCSGKYVGSEKCVIDGTGGKKVPAYLEH